MLACRALRVAPASMARARVPVISAMPAMARGLSTPSYTERMERTGRPVSPHLEIYKFPAAAISSITTRITGCVLTAGTSAIGILTLAGADVPGLVSSFQVAAPVLVPVAKFAVAYPLVYHWGSALRHTYWDVTCQGLHIDTVRTTSYSLLIGSGAISAGLAVMSI